MKGTIMRFIVTDNQKALSIDYQVQLHPETKKKIRNWMIYFGVVGTAVGSIVWMNKSDDKDQMSEQD